LSGATHAAPYGGKLIAAARGWSERFGSTAAAARRLLELFDEPEPEADAAVIDIGNSPAGAGLHVCRSTDAVLMITTADQAAVLGAFAAIKAIVAKDDGTPLLRVSCDCPIYLLVNMAPSAQAAGRVFDRLAWTCRRVLGIELRSAGYFVRQPAEALNLSSLSADTLRRVLVADVLLSWQSRADCNGLLIDKIAEPVEMEF
jgi:MinD-like ATPase involved in chromosome partitioning or flagellar assembly